MLHRSVIGRIVIYTMCLSKGLVINYWEGGGLQNGKIAGPKQFVPLLKTE